MSDPLPRTHGSGWHPLQNAAALVLVLALAAAACAPAIRRTGDGLLPPQQLAELWVAPDDITRRDLFHGPGGKADMPNPDERYEVTDVDATGASPGYDVVDAKGRKWKAKLGEEVQPEIVASRLLWAIGFHQPPMYYVAELKLDGGKPEHQGQPARLRAEFGYDKEDDWSWHENPFVGSRPLNGMLVANLLLNNWDIKPSQNRIYEMDDPRQRPRRRYVVQDLGASLGMTAWPTGTKNNIANFEVQRFIRNVTGDRVEFDYAARHQELLKSLTSEDVVWTCRLLDQLTDDQWNDMFRAANYEPELARRFIIKLKQKMNEGLALGDQDGASRR
jgi:hypothetical protein